MKAKATLEKQRQLVREWTEFVSRHETPGAMPNPRLLVRGFISELRQHNSASTVRTKVSLLRSMAREDASLDPWLRCDLPRAPKKLPRILDLGEVEKMAVAVAAPIDHTLLELCYAGLTASEIAGIRPEDVDWKEATALVYTTGKQRRAMLTSPALAALREVIHHPYWPLSRWSIHRRLAAHGVTPRALRASCAVHLLENGGGLREVQEIMGHASVSTTGKYQLATTAKLRVVINSSHPLAGE